MTTTEAAIPAIIAIIQHIVYELDLIPGALYLTID